MPDDFYYRMSFADYQRRAYYHNLRGTETYKDGWERARFLAYNMLLPHGVKGNIKSVFPFGWDTKEKAARKVKSTKITQDMINELIKRYN